MSLCINGEEQILVLSKRFDVITKSWVLQEAEVSLVLVVLRHITKKQLLEVIIVKNVWVHGPTTLGTTLSRTLESKSVQTTVKSNKFLSSQLIICLKLVQSSNKVTIIVRGVTIILGHVFSNFLIMLILSSHFDQH